MVLMILFLIACSNSKKVHDHCMSGCFAGMNYNGEWFDEIDIKNITEDNLKEFESCEKFCDVYESQI